MDCGVKDVPDDFLRIFTWREASLRIEKMNLWELLNLFLKSDELLRFSTRSEASRQVKIDKKFVQNFFNIFILREASLRAFGPKLP